MHFRLLRVAAAIGAAAAVAAPPAGAETLPDALAKAYANHPQLAAQRAQLRALDEQETQAAGQALGSVDATASYGYSNSDTTTGGGLLGPRSRSRDGADPFSLGLQGSIPIYSGGRIANAASAARQAVLSGRESLLSTEQQVLLDAVTAFEDVRRDLGLVGVARSRVRLIGEQLRAARDRFEVGEVTRTDVSQAEARLAAARSSLAAATGALARSRQAYLAAVGEAPGELEPPPPLPELPESEAAAVALADAQHPEIAAARYDVRQAEFAVKQAIGGMLPSLNMEASASVSDSSVFIDDSAATGDRNSMDFGLRASVPLWSGGRNPSAVREAQARLAQAQAGIHEAARQVRRQVGDAWAGLSVARATITSAREQIRAAQIAFEGVREEATLGARTTLDVLNAEQELQAARADLITALRDEYVAGYALLSAVGSLTVGHLGLDVSPYDPDVYRRQVRGDWTDYPRTEATEWSSRLRP